MVACCPCTGCNLAQRMAHRHRTFFSGSISCRGTHSRGNGRVSPTTWDAEPTTTIHYSGSALAWYARYVPSAVPNGLCTVTIPHLRSRLRQQASTQTQRKRKRGTMKTRKADWIPYNTMTLVIGQIVVAGKKVVSCLVLRLRKVHTNGNKRRTNPRPVAIMHW